MDRLKSVAAFIALTAFGFLGTNAYGETKNPVSKKLERLTRQDKSNTVSEPDVIFQDCVHSIAYDYLTEAQGSSSMNYPNVSVYFAQAKIKLSYQMGSDEVEVYQRFAANNSPILTDERPLKSYKLEGNSSLDDYTRWQFFLEPFLEATRADVEIGGRLPQQNTTSEIAHFEVRYVNHCN